jgi:hypothetical protein
MDSRTAEGEGEVSGVVFTRRGRVLVGTRDGPTSGPKKKGRSSRRRDVKPRNGKDDPRYNKENEYRKRQAFSRRGSQERAPPMDVQQLKNEFFLVQGDNFRCIVKGNSLNYNLLSSLNEM